MLMLLFAHALVLCRSALGIPAKQLTILRDMHEGQFGMVCSRRGGGGGLACVAAPAGSGTPRPATELSLQQVFEGTWRRGTRDVPVIIKSVTVGQDSAKVGKGGLSGG